MRKVLITINVVLCLLILGSSQTFAQLGNQPEPPQEGMPCNPASPPYFAPVQTFRTFMGGCTGEDCSGPISYLLYSYQTTNEVYICTDAVHGQMVWTYHCGFGVNSTDTCEHETQVCRDQIYCPFPLIVEWPVYAPIVQHGPPIPFNTCRDRPIPNPGRDLAALIEAHSEMQLQKMEEAFAESDVENEVLAASREAEDKSIKFCKPGKGKVRKKTR